MDFQNWEILRSLNKKFLDSVEMALVFGNNSNQALLITSDDNVFGIGANTNACLGIEALDPSESYGLPTKIWTISKKGVVEIVLGGNGDDQSFVVAYLHSGEIYRWGRAPFRNFTFHMPSKMSDFQMRVKTVACGASHCIILTEDGQVFTWGQNKLGQLGLYMNGVDESSEPGKIMGMTEDKVIDISCGYNFSVMLLEAGRVLTWGDNSLGQLGINYKGRSTWALREVLSLQDYYYSLIDKIACGRDHVLALSRTGTLYAWGNNSHLQLGSEDFPACKYGCPCQIEFNNLRFTDICASYRHNISVAKCENGKIYMWGETMQGNLKPTETECESFDQVFASFAVPKIMLKPMRRLERKSKDFNEVREVGPSSVSEELEKEFNNPETSDLKIVVDDTEIYVHQNILKMRSEYFNAMITRWLEKDEKLSTITMKEKSYAAIEAYLKYLYTDKLETDLNLTVELLQLADEFGDDKFKSLCEKIIQRSMTGDKVADVFAVTKKLETCQNLNRFCLEFALRHATEVMSSPGFEAWDVDTMKVFINEYVEVKGNCH